MKRTLLLIGLKCAEGGAVGAVLLWFYISGAWLEPDTPWTGFIVSFGIHSCGFGICLIVGVCLHQLWHLNLKWVERILKGGKG